MTYMLDTNALIILLYGEVADGKLSEDALKILSEAERLYLSVVSLWEMAIKMKLGKLEIKCSISKIIAKCLENGIGIIPVKASHMDMTMELPLLSDHKDPFDRMIIAAARVEGMTLISADSKIRRKEYSVDVIY